VDDVDTQDALQVTAVKDQQPVEALRPDGSDEPLGDGVCLRCPHGRLDDADARAAEHLVEGARVLAVAVADQQARAMVGEVEAEVTRLLGDPRSGRVGRAAGEPDASACVRDEEQDVVAAHEHALDGEKVAGNDARRLGAQELAPTRT
jgi:plasmid stabilization system protein ParE